jgi:hypothetical protein
VDKRSLGSGCAYRQRMRMFMEEFAGHMEGLEMARVNCAGKERTGQEQERFCRKKGHNGEGGAPSLSSTRFAKPTRPNAVLVSNQGSLPTTSSAEDSGDRKPECDE